MIPMTFIGISMKGICGNELDYPILKIEKAIDAYWHWYVLENLINYPI